MLVNFLDRVYTSIIDKNRILSRIRFYTVIRIIVRLMANIIIPLYYSITKDSYKLSSNNNNKLIVSLTSFPNRINKVWIVIESLLRQELKPDMIILWLSMEQFRSMEELPKRLLNLSKRGLIIKFCKDDLKSHKKYFYTLKEFPNDFLITVDDDIIYPTTMLGQLVALNKKYPKSICCHRGYRIDYTNDGMLPYNSWFELREFSGPNNSIFFTSGGGTLFPPNSFHKEVFNSEIFSKYCLYADDVWLNIMCRLNSTSIVKSDYYSSLLPIINFNNINLHSFNYFNEGNDIQLNSVRKIYLDKLGIDVFASKQL